MKIEKEIYELEGGYGYRIKVNGRVFIEQPHLPVLPGIIKMSRKQAEKLSNLVIEKLKQNPYQLPTLTIEEVLKI